MAIQAVQLAKLRMHVHSISLSEDSCQKFSHSLLVRLPHLERASNILQRDVMGAAWRHKSQCNTSGSGREKQTNSTGKVMWQGDCQVFLDFKGQQPGMVFSCCT